MSENVVKGRRARAGSYLTELIAAPELVGARGSQPSGIEDIQETDDNEFGREHLYLGETSDREKNVKRRLKEWRSLGC